MKRPAVRLARGFALLFAVVGVGAALEALRAMPMGTPDDPGPGMFPLVLGLAVGALGVATAFTRAWPLVPPIERTRTLVAVSAVVGWAAALPYLGFVVTTVAALVVLGRVIGPAPIDRLLVFALLAGGGASLLFRGLLKLPLPRGPWGW